MAQNRARPWTRTLSGRCCAQVWTTSGPCCNLPGPGPRLRSGCCRSLWATDQARDKIVGEPSHPIQATLWLQLSQLWLALACMTHRVGEAAHAVLAILRLAVDPGWLVLSGAGHDVLDAVAEALRLGHKARAVAQARDRARVRGRLDEARRLVVRARARQLVLALAKAVRTGSKGVPLLRLAV